jgi:hypothetical protein
MQNTSMQNTGRLRTILPIKLNLFMLRGGVPIHAACSGALVARKVPPTVLSMP